MGAGSGAQQTFPWIQGLVLRAGWGEIDRQTHYWALRQQARCFFALYVGEPEVVAPLVGGGLLSLHLWWWGVWCLIRG